MNKCFFALLIALVLLPAASGTTVFERSFGEMGYEPVSIQGVKERACQEIQFLFPEVLVEGKTYYIASIGLELGPIQEGKIDVNLSLNQEEIAWLELQDFKCAGEKCWERVFLPKEKIGQEENFLEICMQTGNAITQISLSNESKVGIYQTADFFGETAFTMQAEKTGLVLGEKTEITLLLHNQGSGPSFAQIQYARPVAEDKNAFWVVEGDNYYSGVVGAGEKVEITYVVKPRRPVQMTLPPAIVYYENEFGEQESRFSNLVTLKAREPERKIEAFIVKEGETALVGQAINMRLAIKNIGNDPLYDLGIELESELDLRQDDTEIHILPPKETRYIDFSASSLEPGKFKVDCTITYRDLNISESSCQQSFVEFSQPGIGTEIYAAIALVAIAVAIYLYLMFGK